MILRIFDCIIYDARKAFFYQSELCKRTVIFFNPNFVAIFGIVRNNNIATF